MTWTSDEARDRLSELADRAGSEGPQRLVVEGRELVVISANEFKALIASRGSFKEFLRSMPDLSELDLTRDRQAARDVEL